MQTFNDTIIPTKQSEVVPVANQTRMEPNPWIPDRKHRWSNGLDWPAVLWIVVVHICALAAPFFFTWKALGNIFVVVVDHRRAGRLLGLSPAVGPREFSDVPILSKVYSPLRHIGRRRSADQLGGRASQTPSQQRCRRRSAFARTTALGGAICFGSFRDPAIPTGNR